MRWVWDGGSPNKAEHLCITLIFRLAVQTSCDIWEMETPPRQADLGKILQTRGGPLCFKGVQCPLYFSLTPSAPLGLDAMAQTVSLHISPDRSAPSNPGQGPSTKVSPLTDSVSLRDSGQERSPISGAGDSISSPVRALEPSCLAPEGEQLRDAGFPAEVVQTILSARAPSTRKWYALRWRVFKSWCMTHHADEVHCQVVSVLEFLQEKLSLGTCPSSMWLQIWLAMLWLMGSLWESTL